ncbi:MAG: oligosaccharide flippase family protein [Vicinamibacterales bacterium]
MSIGTTLAAGALLNTVAFLTSNLRGIFTFLIARWLGSAVLGTFGIAWAVADLASKFGTLGLDYNVVPFVARSEAAGYRADSRRIFRIALSIAVPASLGVAAVSALLAWSSPQWLGTRADLSIATAAMCFGIPGMVLYRVCNGLSRGMHVMQHDIYSRGLTESLGTIVALLVAVGLGAQLLAPVFAAIVGTTLSGVVAFGLARRIYVSGPCSDCRARQSASSGALFRTSLPIAIHDGLNIFILRADVILLGLFVDRAPDVTLESVGIYAACVEIAGGLRKTSQAFTPILTPVLAAQIARGETEAARASYAYVARWMLAWLLPAVAVLALSGGAVLRLFGAGFERGALWLAVTAVACALNAFVGLGETILLIQRPSWNAINASIAAAAAVAVNLWLIPRYGPLGAAAGMLVPYALQGVLRGFQLVVWLHWRWPWQALARPLIAAGAAVPLAVLVRVTLDGTLGDAAAGVLYVGSYAAVWWAMGLEPEDRLVLERLRR